MMISSSSSIACGELAVRRSGAARARSGRRSRACWRRSPPSSVSRGRAFGAASQRREPVAGGGQARVEHRAVGDRVEGARAPRRRGRRRAARAGSRSARCRWPGWWRRAACSLSSAAVGVALGEQLLGGLHVLLGRLLVGARHVLVEELAHLGLGQRADEAVDRLAALEQDAERDAAHAEHLRQLLRDLGLVVGVELDQLEAAGVGGLELLEHRAERLARAAPRRPDVEQHRLRERGVDRSASKFWWVMSCMVSRSRRKRARRGGGQRQVKPRRLQFKPLSRTSKATP